MCDLRQSLTLSVPVSCSVKERWALSQTHGALSGVWSAGRLPSHSPSCVSVSETSPKIFPLTLGSSEPAGYVVIACLVRDFFPSEPLTVTWSPSREGVIVRNFPPAQAGGPVHHEQPADLASRAVPSRSDPEVPSAAPLQIQPVRERALQRSMSPVLILGTKERHSPAPPPTLS
uniref:Ig-like domain-containing protein n=1 Tax=Sus scrofa TaxID=9823 RepID=A0A8D0TZY8_PIG